MDKNLMPKNTSAYLADKITKAVESKAIEKISKKHPQVGNALQEIKIVRDACKPITME